MRDLFSYNTKLTKSDLVDKCNEMHRALLAKDTELKDERVLRAKESTRADEMHNLAKDRYLELAEMKETVLSLQTAKDFAVAQAMALESVLVKSLRR